jgi:hypothetical protein
MGGGSAQPGDGGGESNSSQISLLSSPKYAKTAKKTGAFTYLSTYKSPKTPFFALKYLTRYNLETFFEEYINFKIFHYLSHCGVIPVQSFGSHIRPQLPGLGFNKFLFQHTLLTSSLLQPTPSLTTGHGPFHNHLFCSNQPLKLAYFKSFELLRVVFLFCAVLAFI